MKTILLLALAATAWTQEIKYYRLDFALKELEDTRTLSIKRYSTLGTLGRDARQGQIRAGTRIPYTNGSNTQYYEVGVNIDCFALREEGTRLNMVVTSDISSIPAAEGTTAPVTVPVVRQNRWTAEVTVDLGKPTVLFSSDDPGSKRKLQLEVTATPVK